MIKVSVHPPSIPEAQAHEYHITKDRESLGMEIYEDHVLVKAFCGNTLEAGHSRQPAESNGLWLLLPCFVS